MAGMAPKDAPALPEGNACAIGSTKMDAKVRNVNIKWACRFTIIHARIANVSQNHDANFSRRAIASAFVC
eukprot:scaffold437_cov159-Amphora_coffeaeformis.AAC.27